MHCRAAAARSLRAVHCVLCTARCALGVWVLVVLGCS